MIELLTWVTGWGCAPALLLIPWVLERAGAAHDGRVPQMLFILAVAGALLAEQRELAVIAAAGAGAGWVLGSAVPRTVVAALAGGVALLAFSAADGGLAAGGPTERAWMLALLAPAGAWSLLAAAAVRHGAARAPATAAAMLAVLAGCALAGGRAHIPSAGAALCVLTGGGALALVRAADAPAAARRVLGVVALLPFGVGLVRGPTAAGPYSHPPDLPVRQAAQIELLVDDAAMVSGLTALPDGSIVYGEFASGRIWRLDPTTGVQRLLATVSLPRIQGARDNYELGLWGLASDPAGGAIYAIAIHRWDERSPSPDARTSRIVRVGLDAGDVTTVLDGIPAGPIHAGGALQFGADGTLYASVGDGLRYGARGDQPAPPSDAGTILALDGLRGPQARSRVFARGFRNVYGLAFDDEGRLWATENGPHCCDAVVRVREGGTYGWPPGQTDALAPVWESGAQRLGPTGIVTLSERYGDYAGDLLFATWHTGALHRLRVRGDVVEQHEVLTTVQPRRPRDGPYAFAGAFSALAVAPDGTVWFSTVNAVGRLVSLVQP